jgi:ATP-binding protein involved in chromosome partitioning
MHPPGPPQKISLPGVKQIVAVASGKGGVGKSTVATNLALALKQLGHPVGLLDADIYGPSIPLMMGIPGQVDPENTPLAQGRPMEAHGIKLLSMGFFVKPEQALILRGPMIDKYLKQLMMQFDWSPLEYLIIDMPPGTGDAHLTLAQNVAVSGALIVTTPQEVSLIDARKGVEMFRQVRVPVLGIVENMSYFLGDDGKRYEIFRHGGGRKLASEAGVHFLGEIPIDARVAECGDRGTPIVEKHPDSPIAHAYQSLAKTVIEELKYGDEGTQLPEVKL